MSFYLVGDETQTNGRLIDTADFPKLGYIAATPELMITNLNAVTLYTYAPYSPRQPAITIVMRSKDAQQFATLTKRAAGRKVLLMLDDTPLMAPIYVHLPKCNFDVEISVDAIRLLDQYDTLALFSGDSDFVSLIRFLKKKGKKVLLFKGGFITSDLKKAVDKVINAQNIKKHIAGVVKRQKPGIEPGFANR